MLTGRQGRRAVLAAPSSQLEGEDAEAGDRAPAPSPGGNPSLAQSQRFPWPRTVPAHRTDALVLI